MNAESNDKNIVIVLGPNKHFGPQQATSIDLYTRDCIMHSRFRDRTIVVCPALEEPFHGVETAFYEIGKNRDETFDAVRKTVADTNPALIVLQQQQRMAVRLAQRFHDVPVVLSNHTFENPAKNWFSRKVRARRMQSLAALIFVSEPCLSNFREHWPKCDVPNYVVPNGLDFSDWTPEPEREKTVLFAGRLVPEKGVLELARALAVVLPDYKDWNACFICNRTNKSPQYAAQVRAALSNTGNQSEIKENQPFEVVKRHMERAAIVVVPSRWQEPFGRTALEAFAGGAALITSGTGGLTEIVGDDAIVEPDLTREVLGAALRRLIENNTLRESLSRRGRKRGEAMYDIRRVSSRLDAIYSSVRETRLESGMANS